MAIKPKIEIEQPIELQINFEAPYEIVATQMGLAAGPRGHTPYIGENGNWWIAGEDTGVPSSGEPFWELDGPTKLKPSDDKTVDGQHISGIINGGLFHP